MLIKVSSSKSLLLILIGLFVYYIGLLVSDYIFHDAWYPHLLSILGALCFVMGILSCNKNLNHLSLSFKILVIVFLTLCLIHIVLGVPQAILQGRSAELIYNSQFLWMYVIGFAILISPNLKFFRTLFKFSQVYLIASFIFCIYNFNDLFLNPVEVLKDAISHNNEGLIVNRAQEPGNLFIPITFFLIFFKRFNKYLKLLILITFVFCLLSAMFMGRRSASVTLTGYVLIPIFVYLAAKMKRVFVSSVLLIVLIVICVNFSTSTKMDFFLEDNFEVMSNKMGNDTRSGTEEDFYKDMSEWSERLVGRGMTGMYRSPAVADVDRLYRPIIETGYLNIILHGGIIMLIPYLLLLLYSGIKGILKSKSMFVKCCGTLCLYRILLLYPGGHLNLTLTCLLLFVAMRFCQTSYIRNMTDKDFVNALKLE